MNLELLNWCKKLFLRETENFNFNEILYAHIGEVSKRISKFLFDTKNGLKE